MTLTRTKQALLALPGEAEPITMTPVPYSQLCAALAAFKLAGLPIYGMRHHRGHWVLTHGPLTPAQVPTWASADTQPAWSTAIMREYLFPTK